jgi:hypothetical protein
VLLPYPIERLFGIDRPDDDVYRRPPEIQEATDHGTGAKGPQVVVRSCHALVVPTDNLTDTGPQRAPPGCQGVIEILRREWAV